jgi:hypothetical protein
LKIAAAGGKKRPRVFAAGHFRVIRRRPFFRHLLCSEIAISTVYRNLQAEPAEIMDKRWRILYCDGAEHECPITGFIDTCPPRHQVKILRFLALLEEMGPALHRPYADILYEGVYELRIKLSGEHVRLLYFFCFQKYIILYQGFFKRTRRVPDQIVRRVIRYRDNLLERTDAKMLESLLDEDL